MLNSNNFNITIVLKLELRIVFTIVYLINYEL